MAGFSCSRLPRLKALACAFCVSLVVVMVPVVPAGGAPSVWWVGPGGSDLSGTGSHSAPYRTITQAFTHAVDGDAVKVLPGVYNAMAGETFPLVVPTGVDLIGVGPGKPKIVGNQLDTVVSVTNPRLVEICGLEISGGGSDDVYPHLGGGIFVQSGASDDSILINDCWIHDNETISNSSGGGIRFAGPMGAGPQVMVIGCRIEDNVAHGSGGGVAIVEASTVTLRDCIITGNTATWDSARGGGVSVTRCGQLYFEDCEITRNHAGTSIGGSGGGFHLFECAGKFTNNLVALNSARGNGNAGELDGTGYVVMRNNTFADNFVSPPSPAATTCLVRTSQASAALVDSIAWGNTPKGISNSTMFFNNVIADDPFISAPEVTDTDPLFARGGTEENPDYHLTRESPCVDAGEVNAGYLDHDLDYRPRPIDGDAIAGAVPDIGCYELFDGTTRRLAAADRYATACEIWKNTLPEASTASAVIATGANFPDALAASALAGAVDGPLLLVKKDSVPQEVLDTLAHLGVNGIYIVGGTAGVSSAVEATLESEGYNVIRIAGGDRFATAAAVLAEVKYLMGPRYSNRVFVATGANFPDALAASPWAYAEGIPVLLTKKDELPQVTAEAILSGGTSVVWIVGGEGVVAPAVAGAIDALPGIAPPARLAGGTRYETAVAVANKSTGEDIVPELHWHEPGLATGLNFPDALAGGAASGAWGSPLLLTRTAELPKETGTGLLANKSNVYRISVMGGAGAVTEAVMTAAGQVIQ